MLFKNQEGSLMQQDKRKRSPIVLRHFYSLISFDKLRMSEGTLSLRELEVHAEQNEDTKGQDKRVAMLIKRILNINEKNQNNNKKILNEISAHPDASTHVVCSACHLAHPDASTHVVRSACKLAHPELVEGNERDKKMSKSKNIQDPLNIIVKFISNLCHHKVIVQGEF